MFVKGYRSAKRTAGKKEKKREKKEITKQAFKSRLFFERKERKERKEKGCLDARPRRALGGDPPRPPLLSHPPKNTPTHRPQKGKREKGKKEKKKSLTPAFVN